MALSIIDQPNIYSDTFSNSDIFRHILSYILPTSSKNPQYLYILSVLRLSQNYKLLINMIYQFRLKLYSNINEIHTIMICIHRRDDLHVVVKKAWLQGRDNLAKQRKWWNTTKFRRRLNFKCHNPNCQYLLPNESDYCDVCGTHLYRSCWICTVSIKQQINALPCELCDDCRADGYS